MCSRNGSKSSVLPSQPSLVTSLIIFLAVSCCCCQANPGRIRADTHCAGVRLHKRQKNFTGQTIATRMSCCSSLTLGSSPTCSPNPAQLRRILLLSFLVIIIRIIDLTTSICSIRNYSQDSTSVCFNCFVIASLHCFDR